MRPPRRIAILNGHGRSNWTPQHLKTGRSGWSITCIAFCDGREKKRPQQGDRVPTWRGWSPVAEGGLPMSGSRLKPNCLNFYELLAQFVVLFAVCVTVGWYCAWKNVTMSLILTLALEGISMAFILLLCAIVLFHHNFAFDSTQFTVGTLPWSSVGLGVVVAIFSLVGFESATAFGDEAKNPLKTIPRSVYVSLVISGLFFVFVTYVEIMGTHGYKDTLDKIDAALNVLATLSNVPLLQIPLSLGAMMSFFALCMSCINAGGRVIYAMGRHGLFHSATADAHAKNETPHVAVSLMAVLAFAVPAAMNLGGIAPLDGFNYVGTCAAFGFVVAYALVTVAAPVYLKRIGELTGKDIVGCVAALALLAIPAVGSVYPIPDPPVNYFPYGFLVYLAIGIGWILYCSRRKPTAIERVQADLERIDARIEDAVA